MSGLQKYILSAVYTLCALVASLAPESTLAADGANGRRNVLAQGFGVRALSLGGAYVSLAGDADATFWNPAGLTALDRQSFGATHSRFFEGTEINSATWGHSFDDLGAFGVSFTRLELDDFPAVQNWVVSPQNIGFTTSLTSISYARGFGQYFSAGVTGKALYESLFGSQDYGFGFDIGLSARKDRFRAGVIVRDIGSSEIKLGVSGEDQPLSAQFGLAFDSLRLMEDFSVTASAEVELIESRSAIGHVGAEALLHNTLALRAGVDDGDATFGAGFVIDDFRFDYGYRVMSDIGDTHLFGLSFLFGSTAEQRRQKRLAQQTQQGEAYADADRRKRAEEAAQKATAFESAGELDSALVYLQLAGSLDSSAADVTSRITTIQQALAEQAKKDSLAIVESAGLDSL